MWVVPLRGWALLAVLLAGQSLSSIAADCPVATPDIQKVQPPRRNGGLVLMQKGIQLSQTKPQSLQPTRNSPQNAELSGWAGVVVNASSSAAAAYKDTLNSSSSLLKRLLHLKDEQVHTSFLRSHWSLFVAIFVVFLFCFLVAIFDRTWDKKQKTEEHDSNLAAQTECFALDLVRHLLPSTKVDRHQFRGLTRKESSISLGFEDLGLEIPGHGKILDGVSGEFKAGRMTIILGPSGAGKTTFMNALCGKASYGQTSGKIFVNSIETNLADFKSVIGFVPQDDVVHEKLTVREQIHFSAQLRNSADTSEATLHHIVDDVLAVLQIEHIQRSIVGGVEERGISGGQRKRVNIGLELAAFPTLLFLDEPTSGLDSTSSLALARSLKKMTQLGITIVVVAHQPRWSLFTLFDDVHVLAKGGKTAYLGPTAGVCGYFERLGFKKPADENLADWLMDIVSGIVPNPNSTKFDSAMLVSSWADRDKAVDLRPKSRLQPSGTRNWTAHDDRAVLQCLLEDEWAKVDFTRSGSLSASELTTLLSNTAGEEPSEEVASELTMQIAGHGAKSVSKAQFVDYFVALEEVITSSAKPYIDTWANASGSPEEVMTFTDLRRVTPGFLMQYRILLRRRMVQVSRYNKQRLIDVCLILTVSLLLGFLSRGQMTFRDPFFASKILVFQLGLCLLVTVSCLRTFGADRLVWWRDCSSGLNVFSFFCARMTIDTLDVFLQCVLYTSMFFLVAQPSSPFRVHFLPCLYLSFAASGWGYFISAVFPPQNASLVAILFILVTNGFLGDPGAANGHLALASMTRWSSQMTYLGTADIEGSFLQGGFPSWAREEIAEVATKVPPNPLDVFRACGFMSSSMVEAAFRMSSVNKLLGHWYSASFVLVVMAIVLRLFAFLAIRFFNRGKFA